MMLGYALLQAASLYDTTASHPPALIEAVMKALPKFAATALIAAVTTWTQAADVNVGVTISGEIRPGVYGQVNIGTVPNYALVYPQPMVIAAPPTYGVPVQAMYLHVPPGHAKHWSKHCHEYNACGRPVYFIRSAEYEPGYQPYSDNSHDHHDSHKHGNGKGKGKHKH
jgi:hypothetical protein